MKAKAYTAAKKKRVGDEARLPAVLGRGRFALAAPLALAQRGAPGGEWPTYGGDLGHTRYAPLDQIDASNFSRLEIAWRFKTDSLGPNREFNFQSTPLMVDGVIYSTAGSRRAVVALDAGNGELLWIHRLDEGERGQVAPRQLSGRGLAYWENGDDKRIVYVTPGYQMIALDARTGDRVESFGDGGIVDLKQNIDQNLDPLDSEIGLHATPIVAKNVIIVGAAHPTGANPTSARMTKGYVRGFDARTGERLWIFHTVPMRGEFGTESWLQRLERVHGQHGRLGADLRRPGARDRVSARRGSDRRLHRHRPARRQPVQRDAARRRSQHRRAQVALPARAPRHLGHGHSVLRRSCSTPSSTAGP